jgi:2-iminobutanoate/2-iminopropanoate deaminase
MAALRHYVAPENPGENYATAVVGGGLVFVCGQLGAEPGGPGASFQEQLRLALGRLIAAVEACGGARETIVKVNGYIADVSYFDVYHAVYREVIGPGPMPARTTVQVGGFVPPILVEVDAIAVTRESASGTDDG